jgi:hypothetical protein
MAKKKAPSSGGGKENKEEKDDETLDFLDKTEKSESSSSSSSSSTASGYERAVEETPNASKDTESSSGTDTTTPNNSEKGNPIPGVDEPQQDESTPADNAPDGKNEPEQGVEEGDGTEAKQASELEQRVLKESDTLNDPSEVAVRRDGDRLVAEPTVTGEQVVEKQVREDVASENENLDAEDLTVTREDGQNNVDVRESSQREIIAGQFEEENPNLDRGEDYEIEQTDEGYRISLTEQGEHERVRQQVASQREGVDPEDVNVSEAGETLASQSGGERRLLNEAGSDGENLMVDQYEVEVTTDPEPVDSDEVEGISEEDAVDAGPDTPTQSTRTDVAAPGLATDEGVLADQRNELNPNANLGEDVEDVGDIEISINDRPLESVLNEGSERWDDASVYVGERAGDAAEVVDQAGQTEIPATDTSVYDAAGIESNSQGEGPVESGTEAVVAGVGRSVNPYAVGSATKEVAEAGVYVGSAAVSANPEETLDRTNTVVSQGAVAAGLAARYAGNNPVETGGTIVGGVLTGTAASSAVRRVPRARQRARVARSRARQELSERTRAARTRARQEIGQRTQAARARVRREFGQARQLSSDTRAQANLSRTKTRSDTESKSEVTETISRDDPEADPSDPTPEEWARQKFEGDSGQTADTSNQRVLEEEIEVRPGEEQRARSVEDELPPRDEFPSEQAYQQELERARARQEMPAREVFPGGEAYQRELNRLVERRRSEQETSTSSLTETETKTRTRQRTRAAGTTAGRPAGTLAVAGTLRPESTTEERSAIAQTTQDEELTATRTVFEEGQRSLYGTQGQRERTGTRSQTETLTDTRQTYESTATSLLNAESSLTATRTATGTTTRTSTRTGSQSNRGTPRPNTDPSRDVGDASGSFESADARWDTQFADADELAEDVFGGR